MTKQRAQMVFLCICSVLFSSSPCHAKEKITFTPKEGSARHEAKTESCEIQVFKDAKPDQEYVDLGIINYHEERHRANSGALKLDVAMPKIKALACKVGGDALIDIRVTEVRRLEFAMFNVRATVVKFSPK
jgi:GTP cyclohydrolase III